MPSGTADSGFVALDGKVYVVGGSTFRAHILPTSSDMGSGTWGSTVNYATDQLPRSWASAGPNIDGAHAEAKTIDRMTAKRRRRFIVMPSMLRLFSQDYRASAEPAHQSLGV